MSHTTIYWTKQAYECHMINGSCSKCSLRKYNLITACRIHEIVKNLIKNEIQIPHFISQEGFCEVCGQTKTDKFKQGVYNICTDCYKEKQKIYNQKHNRSKKNV